MISNILLVITATLTALMARLFYAWSCSEMLGFARLKDREFVSVMQKTNRAIQNPVFFAAFFGAPVFLIISTVYFYGQSRRFALLFAAIVFLFIFSIPLRIIIGNSAIWLDFVNRLAPQNQHYNQHGTPSS